MKLYTLHESWWYLKLDVWLPLIPEHINILPTVEHVILPDNFNHWMSLPPFKITCTNIWSQLPHSYYFTRRILVLKFVNKGVFFEEIRIRIFLEKGGILVLTSMNLEKKGLFFMSSVLPWKGGFIWANKSVFYLKEGGSFWTQKSVLHRKKGVVLNWKVSVFAAKKGVIFKLENKDGYHFSSEWGSRAYGTLFSKLQDQWIAHHLTTEPITDA